MAITARSRTRVMVSDVELFANLAVVLLVVTTTATPILCARVVRRLVQFLAVCATLVGVVAVFATIFAAMPFFYIMA